ncbi:MAG: M13 family metallopeptidase, partial [Gammaproteobacteria bacterium]
MRLTTCLLAGALGIMPLGAFAALSANSAGAEGLHLNWLDTSVNPAKNFFEYANGGWQKANPIPAAYSRWGTFNILAKQNQEAIRQILENAAKDKSAKPGSVTQKVGDFYASGMDEAAINKAGIEPLSPEFKRIADISNLNELQSDIAHLQMIGVDALFDFGQMQDFKDSSKVVGAAFQGGLG